jgi:hypothetical protein
VALQHLNSHCHRGGATTKTRGAKLPGFGLTTIDQQYDHPSACRRVAGVSEIPWS